MKKQLLILALTGLAFTACKKDDDASTSQRLVKKITEISDGDTATTNFSYDNNKRITLIKTSEGTEVKLTYTGNNLTSVENKIDADNKTKLEVSYDGAKPTSAIYSIYEDDVLDQKYRLTYSLNANNQVKEILMKDSTNANVVSKQVFTYTNNNITKLESYLGTTLVGTQEFTYGSKKSAFSGVNFNYVVDFSLLELFSDNEVTKLKHTITNITHETTNTYTYSPDGFPVSATVSEKTLPNGAPEASTLKFEYQ